MVIPENCSRLPAHMSLTAKLLASPRALTRIQLYCKNRPGYIVPGTLGGEEVSAPRKDYAFRRQFNDKPSVVSGCPASVLQPDCVGQGCTSSKGGASLNPMHSISDAIQGEKVAICPCCYTRRGSDNAFLLLYKARKWQYAPVAIQGEEVAICSCCYTRRGSDDALNGALCLNCLLAFS